MKIRTSLRLYVLGTMLLSGTLVVSVMSVVAVNYFFYGLDTAMAGLMRSQAFIYQVADGEPVQTQEMTIASRWEDLPVQIQNQFDRSEVELEQLEKRINGIPLIKRPETGYFLMKLERDDQVRYASVVFNDLQPERFSAHEPPKFVYILLSAAGAIVLFGGLLFVLTRRVSMPIRRLRDWAKGLNKDQLKETAPDFHYSELNSLADIIQSSLSSVQKGLEREQQFLGYASHELRTPIAVTRSNAELLQKMIERDIKPEKQLEVLGRIRRASFTMSDLTDTLLWLNRQEDKQLPIESIIIGDLINQIQTELRYLLAGKQVKVTLSHDSSQLSLPSGLCRIVITNLIRNAFQHTYEGEVVIEQVASRLSIINRNSSDESEQNDLGFGLGLELTDRLVKQYGWSYSNQPIENGRSVEIEFLNS
ncbi:HAMP domain-containing sensor histidine kinase [Vibrio sp. FNV 38]|nr:HAMP domain-containing sensor histidine kinase [Vibrio sp. FNV 38]